MNKERKLRNQEIIEYVQKWINTIEVTNSIQTLQHDKDIDLAYNLYELLEKSITYWEENNWESYNK